MFFGWEKVGIRLRRARTHGKGRRKIFLLLLSSFIACEQAPLFGQAKRASRKCANEGPFPCLLANSLHLARVASVSNRVIARKLERKQKKKRVQSSYCAKVRADPLPRHSFFCFALVPVFYTNLARKRLLRRLRFTRPSRRACLQAIPSMGSPSVPSRLNLPSIFSHPQKGTSLYIKRLPTYSEKEPSREVENFDSDKEPTVFFSVDFQSFNRYFV